MVMARQRSLLGIAEGRGTGGEWKGFGTNHPCCIRHDINTRWGAIEGLRVSRMHKDRLELLL